MSEALNNRHEILFLYDVKDTNPNGDPMDENKPRIDEETGHNIVTDVRLKRTIRDFIWENEGLEVFVRESRKDDGNLKTKEERLNNLEITSGEELLEKCVDIRLFGATAAIKKKTITFTGPVQFKFGRSLHRVKLDYFKGTTVMPSGESKKQGTFTEVYTLPYSLIVFYGIVNENAAQTTQLTEGDLDLLMKGLWNGTKNLISRSKVGQMPRFLLDVVYREPHFHIGDLDKMVQLNASVEDEAIRDVVDFTLDFSELWKTLVREKEKIERIRLRADDRLKISPPLEDPEIQRFLSGVKFSAFQF